MDNNNKTNRREFIKTTGKAGLATGLSMAFLPSLAGEEFGCKQPATGAEEIAYTQQPLPYAYTALEPAIDAQTMEIHYSKHAAGYATNLADAVKAEGVDKETVKLVSLLGTVSKFSTKLRNNAGGHYNHEFFWKSMKAPSENNAPSGSVAAAITNGFGSFDEFKTKFADAGKGRFGSGWAWLVLSADRKLVIGSTPNQDNPLMDVSELKGTPLLGLDVWEHAYYLKYQNRRPDYITAWWNTINWDVIQKRFDSA